MKNNFRWLVIFLIPPLVLGAFSLVSWYMLAGGVIRNPMRIEYVIPSGAAQRIANGEALPTIPAKAVFVAGDRLVFRNEDQTDHRVGPFWIPSGSTLTIPLERASSISYLCTVHPSGTIDLDVRPQNSAWLMLIPTLALGIPLGGVLTVIVRVVSRLE
ncbi:MAG: hypothetical protein HZB52_05300 [Chloroflexi bacterium]|nr:hypothetical protein [Chloroflexota bacterium]